MGFNRNMNQKVTSGRRRQSVESPSSSTSNKVPQKNMETMRILSNIKIPAVMPVENHSQLWNATTQQNQGYFTDITYENEWFQEGSQQQQIGEGLCQSVTSALETDIVDQALTDALNARNHENEKMNSEVMAEISELNALIQPLSPWEDDQFTKPQSHISVGNKKEKTTAKSKSRRLIQNEQSLKKQKLQDRTKNVTGSSELKSLLEKKDNVQPPTIDRAVPSTSTANVMPEHITISVEDEDIDMNIFSQDSEITVIKQVIALKKSLMKSKEEVEREFKKKEGEANTLQSQIDNLNKHLTEAKKCLSEMEQRQKILSKKLKLISQL